MQLVAPLSVASDHSGVAGAKIIWQEKVRRRIGWPKKGVCARFARGIKEPSRTVYGWLRWDRSPHDEDAVLQKAALYLKVPRSWLSDGKEGDPPQIDPAVSAEWVQVIDRTSLPPRIKRLAYALADRAAAEWLADAYERLYLPARKA